MLRYHYYVSAGPQCDDTTRIYKVAVGINLQAQRDFQFLTDYATQHGHYFAVVGDASDVFIMKLRRSLAEYDVQLTYCSARDLVRLFKDATGTALNPAVLRSIHSQQTLTNIDYRISSNLARRASSPAKRSR